MVGIGCLTAGYYECINLLEDIKRKKSNIITFVGGHHPAVMPKDFVGKYTDYIVIGEGEKTFRELVDTLD